MLLLGDCLTVLKDTADNSIDLIVTDPPYGIEFMGKDWDRAIVSTETWRECYRVLKEGKLAFVMCSPRQDVLSRMVINLQDAGFRTNYTSIYWTYASGFPKAANVSKLLDKKNGRDFNPELRAYLNQQRIKKNLTFKDINEYLGYSIKGGNFASDLLGDKKDNRYLLPDVETYNKLKTLLDLDDRYDEFIKIEEAEREILETKWRTPANPEYCNTSQEYGFGKKSKGYYDITKPATEAAKKMEGAYVGFQPKPAVEVILVVSKGKTLSWLDDCRIPYQSEDDTAEAKTRFTKFGYRHYCEDKGYDHIVNGKDEALGQTNEKGRFPANLLVSDDCLNDFKKPSIAREKNPNWRGGFYKECVVCHNDFWVSPSIAEKRTTCSLECKGIVHSEVMRHDGNPNWRGGESVEYKKGKTDILWKQRRYEVYQRDNFQCQVCGKQNGELHAHHIIPWRLSHDDSMENLISLCPECHTTVEASWKTVRMEEWAKMDNGYSRYFSLDQWTEKTFPFLIVPKASRSERGAFNNHATVKPIKLLSYLITMGSREGDLVLDPFCGSGTVCIAADQLHRKWIGIEKNEEYAAIIKKRLMVPLSQLKLTRYLEDEITEA